MRVLALVPNQKGHSPGQRGSIELWEKVLAPAGIEIVYAPFETDRLRQILYTHGNSVAKTAEMIKGYVDRFRLLGKLSEFDAVFVYREAALLGPAIFERLIARKKPVIYQLDDPLFVPYRSPSNGYFSYLKFFGKVKEIIRRSKVVMVNSTHIREYAEQFNSAIWQVPSVVDTEKFTFEPRADSGRVCVGWSGSATTLKNIKLVEEPLREISARKTADLLFIGGRDFDLQGVDYEAKVWSEETEVEDLRRIDIGLVPLPDNPWNKYKFIMKTAQYMALGIVPIGTPMASNPEVITPGVTGFLAGTNEEWTRYIELLASDHDLRAELSRNAAARAQKEYSLSGNASKIVEAFRAAVA